MGESVCRQLIPCQQPFGTRIYFKEMLGGNELNPAGAYYMYFKNVSLFFDIGIVGHCAY